MWEQVSSVCAGLCSVDQGQYWKGDSAVLVQGNCFFPGTSTVSPLSSSLCVGHMIVVPWTNFKMWTSVPCQLLISGFTLFTSFSLTVPWLVGRGIYAESKTHILLHISEWKIALLHVLWIPFKLFSSHLLESGGGLENCLSRIFCSVKMAAYDTIPCGSCPCTNTVLRVHPLLSVQLNWDSLIFF